MCCTRALTIILKCKIGCKIRQKKYIFYNNVYFFNFFCLCPFLSPHLLLPPSSLLLSLSTLTSHLFLNKNLSYIACDLLFFCTFTRSNNYCKQKDLIYNGKQFS